MRRHPLITTITALPIVSIVSIVFAAACGGGTSSTDTTTTTDATSDETSQANTGGEQSGEGNGDGEAGADNEFHLNETQGVDQVHGDHPSEIEATETEAAMRLFVVDPETGPIDGIVIKMTGPNGADYFTKQTDTQGYTEVLVPAGRRYALEYLTLGHQNATANVDVPAGRNQDIRLTLRYRRIRGRVEAEEPHFVLDGLQFDSSRATIREESFPRLDRVVEYMTHKPTARIRVAGYTDNQGNARTNRNLSERRAQAVRDYLVSHGIDAARIEAVGYGDENPIASNDTEEGRQQNRRIEAVEL